MSQMQLSNVMLSKVITLVKNSIIELAGDNATVYLFSAYTGTLGPAATLAQFTEASFPGYAPYGLYLVFGPPARVQDGQYQIATPQFSFTATSGGPYAILGYYVATFSPPQLLAFELFDAPWLLTPGNPLTLQLKWNEWSRSILP